MTTKDLGEIPSPKRKRTSGALALPVVETEVRKSNRIRSMNDGFKRNSCAKKNCAAYSIKDPSISSKVIRSLGEPFCKIDPLKLTEEQLDKKKVPSQPVSASRAYSSSEDSSANDSSLKAKDSKKCKHDGNGFSSKKSKK